MRRELGYAEGDRIYVYSGSLVSYQRFDETAFLFQGWRAVDPRAHLLCLPRTRMPHEGGSPTSIQMPSA